MKVMLKRKLAHAFYLYCYYFRYIKYEGHTYSIESYIFMVRFHLDLNKKAGYNSDQSLEIKKKSCWSIHQAHLAFALSNNGKQKHLFCHKTVNFPLHISYDRDTTSLCIPNWTHFCLCENNLCILTGYLSVECYFPFLF